MRSESCVFLFLSGKIIVFPYKDKARLSCSESLSTVLKPILDLEMPPTHPHLGRRVGQLGPCPPCRDVLVLAQSARRSTGSYAWKGQRSGRASFSPHAQQLIGVRSATSSSPNAHCYSSVLGSSSPNAHCHLSVVGSSSPNAHCYSSLVGSSSPKRSLRIVFGGKL